MNWFSKQIKVVFLALIFINTSLSSYADQQGMCISIGQENQVGIPQYQQNQLTTLLTQQINTATLIGTNIPIAFQDATLWLFPNFSG